MAKELYMKKIQTIRDLVKVNFDIDLTPTQENIVKDILAEKDLIISAMTRYGKSLTIAIGTLCYILFNENKKIVIVAPTFSKSKIIMNYMTEYLLKSNTLRNLIDIEKIGLERIRKEVSQKRITFKNGCEVRILSAEGTGERLMGFGADLVICDEDALISDRVFGSKILRMLGENPENSFLIQIGNPYPGNHFERTWNTAEEKGIKKYHIDWKLALKEGRTTKEFIKKQKENENITEADFKILYEAEFVEEEGRFLTRNLVMNAVSLERRQYPKEGYDYFCGVDVARYGTDETAHFIVGTKDYKTFEAFDYETISKSSIPEVVGKTLNLNKKWNFKKIIVDETGLSGVGDDLREAKNKENLNFRVRGVNFSSIYDRANLYNNLKQLFEKEKIKLFEDNKLINQLTSYGFKFNSAGKQVVVKTETGHDDLSDALGLAVFEIKREEVATYSYSLI